MDAAASRAETPEFIGRFEFDRIIISVSGGDAPVDTSDDEHAEVAAPQAAMRQSDEAVLAYDASKHGRVAVAKLAKLADLDEMVCDAPPAGPLRNQFDATSLSLVVAP